MTARQILARITLVATEVITANRIVAYNGAHTANKGCGVAERDAALGEAIPVAVQGVTHVETGAAVTAGDMLTADSAGKAVKVDPTAIALGSTAEVIGVAIDGAVGAGVLIRAYIAPAHMVGTLLPERTVALTAGEAITSGRIVDAAGTHTAGKGIGVAVAAADSGAAVTVQYSGVAAILSGAAFAVGDYITADGNGKAVKYDPANVNIGTVVGIVGVALAAATDADQSKNVLLMPCVAVGTKALG